jgi:acyl-CoA dehydrogenase
MDRALFGDQHERFRKAVRSFVEAEIAPHADEWDEAGRIPRELFRRLGALGFLGIEFPEAYGGAGGDLATSIVFAEELARGRSGGVAFSVIVHTDMSSPWLVRFGTEEQRRRYLPSIARGEIVCALAITEPGAGSDMARLSTRARRDGDHWVLTGAKTFITNGVYGDLYFVAARTRDDGPPHRGLSQFLVERGTPGLIVSRTLDKTGMRASDTAELAFDGVRVPAANLLGEEGRGFYQLASGLQRERLMAAVLCVAASQRALEDCQAYLQHRQAFGRPLAEMQVLRHRLADMATRIEAARRLTYHAAALFGDGQPCEREVSMAKLFATEMASAIGFDAVQLHGGYGYMREFPVERFARDYRLWTIASGTSEMMREIIAKKLL